jgi:serine-type D-Ala-D-Ala carboxypeptidase
VDKTSRLNTEAKRSALSLERACAGQEARFAGAFEILHSATLGLAFPGAAVAVTHEGKLVASAGCGRFTYETTSPAVQADTMYDLASVTKAIATTTMAMILYERGELELDAPVCGVSPEFAAQDARRREITFRMLLAHSSGLPAYVRLFETARARGDLVAAAMRTPLVAEPGERAEYSDIGFIVLGECLARIADEPLDTFCQREIFGPLGMSRTSFKPGAEWKRTIPPTEEDKGFRQRVIQGEVQDENAYVMGGVAGHAGLFAPAQDVATFAHCMLQGGRPILRPETVARFTRREESPAGTSRALGWDTPSEPSQSGTMFSPRSFGHLGYAGTSLWIDAQRDVSITLLTNRTWPDRKSQKIKQVRPAFHDAIMKATLEGGQ